MNRIEKIIKKAECIRDYLKEINKYKSSIVQNIEDLRNYWDKHGDLPKQKFFYITITYMDLRDIGKDLPVYQERWDFGYHGCVQDEKRTLVVKSSEFTVHIMESILPYIKKGGACILSMPPAVIEPNIADIVWDIESMKIEDMALTNKLITAGLSPTTNNIRFVRDFD